MSPCEVEERDGCVVVRILYKHLLSPELADVSLQLHALVRRQEAPLVVLDMQRVEFLTSAGVGLLFALTTSLKRRHRVLRICGVNARAMELLSLLRVDTVLAIYENVEDAIRDQVGDEEGPFLDDGS